MGVQPFFHGASQSLVPHEVTAGGPIPPLIIYAHFSALPSAAPDCDACVSVAGGGADAVSAGGGDPRVEASREGESGVCVCDEAGAWADDSGCSGDFVFVWGSEEEESVADGAESQEGLAMPTCFI